MPVSIYPTVLSSIKYLDTKLPNLIHHQFRDPQRRAILFPQHDKISIRTSPQRPLHTAQIQNLRRSGSHRTKSSRNREARPPPKVIQALKQTDATTRKSSVSIISAVESQNFRHKPPSNDIRSLQRDGNSCLRQPPR